MFRRTLLLLVVLSLIPVGFTFAQDGPPPSPPSGRPALVECVDGEAVPCIEIVDDVSDIVGTWRRYFEGGAAMGYTVYTEDGGFGISFDPQAEPNIAGTITFEDGLAMIAASEGGPAPAECIAPGTYEIRLIRVGEQPVALTYFQIGEDNCTGRTGDFSEPMLYYDGSAVAELNPDVDALAQSLVPCPDEMDSEMEAYACDVIATSPDDIVGIWKQYLGNPNLAAPMGMGYIQYMSDGRYFIADTTANTADVYENYPFGTITFEDTVATIGVESQVPPECATGDYYLRVIKLGDQPVALTYTIVDDACLPRRGDLGEALIWVAAE